MRSITESGHKILESRKFLLHLYFTFAVTSKYFYKLLNGANYIKLSYSSENVRNREKMRIFLLPKICLFFIIHISTSNSYLLVSLEEI